MMYFPLPAGVEQSWHWLPEQVLLAKIGIAMDGFNANIGGQIGSFVPGLIGAFLILIAGLIVATIAKVFVKAILKRTNLDSQLAAMVRSHPSELSLETWAGNIVYWMILLFTLMAILNALKLTIVSEPINGLLSIVFEYVPRILGAGLILCVTWVIATIAKIALTRGMSRLNLEERLAEQTGVTSDGSLIEVSTTLGNVVYWFIFLLALPLVLGTLQLPGLLGPVQGLIDTFLSAIPKLVTAGLIMGIGWLVAKIVSGIVSNLMITAGADRLGARFGLAPTARGGVSLSNLAGVLTYVLILIPAAISALNELDVQAISGPAISMLQSVLLIIPQILAAGVVLTLFYFIGKFVADLVVSFLSAIGFDNILDILGLPDLPSAPTAPDAPLDTAGQPMSAASFRQTPSEIIGVLTLVAIVLFGAITATEILGFEVLTTTVRAILRVAAQVFSGLLVFGIGLYVANLAHRLVSNMGGKASTTLAQTARIAIIAFVGAMALQQMGVATSIVNLAFGLLLGAISVAIAIAFGLGGRDVAGDKLREWLDALK
jgi:Conserved TM helix